MIYILSKKYIMSTNINYSECVFAATNRNLEAVECRHSSRLSTPSVNEANHII